MAKKKEDTGINLTLKQELACRHFVENGNKSDAYRSAYDCSNMKSETINRTAFDLFNNHKITARIEELRKELYEQLNISLYSVARDFQLVKERSLQKEPVTDVTGQTTGEWKFDGTNAIKANIELGKIIGVYEKDNKQKLETPTDYSKLTVEELIQFRELQNKLKS